MSKEVDDNDSKEITKTEWRELKALPDYEFKRLHRVRTYEKQREKTTELGRLTYVKKDKEEKPNYGKLILSFNDHVKKTLGFGCDEIDKIENGFLCVAVTNCREKYTLIMDKFIAARDGSLSHYKEMKSVIRSIPVIEKQSLEQLGVLK